MPEASLKELSDRAPQGEWTLEEMPNDAGSRSNEFTSFGIEAEGKTLLDTLNATGMYLEQEPDGDGGYSVWDAQGKAVVEYVLAIVRAHRAGQLHDVTALAEAMAQARRDAFEEAAKLIGPHGPRPCDCEPWGCCCQNPGDTAAVAAWDQETALAAAIRALATAPAETEKPETGEASDGR